MKNLGSNLVSTAGLIVLLVLIFISAYFKIPGLEAFLIVLTLLCFIAWLWTRYALKRINIKNVNFFANHLIHNDNDKFEIEFPLYNHNCIKGSGMCKCKQVKEAEFCYIGDGNSDICVAKDAEIVFAKKFLANYCNKNDIKYYLFETFHDIIKAIKSF